VSNHAASGSESRHNLIYWRCGDFAGIGPGAHGRLTLDGRRLAVEAPRAPGEWLSAVEARGSGDGVIDVVTPEEQATEYLMMALRLSEGLDLARYGALAGKSPDAGVVDDLCDMGLVVTDGLRLHATAAGRAVLNSVIRNLMP